MITDRIDRGISDWSARAFKAAAVAELGEPSERVEDMAQRELLVAVDEGRISQQIAARLQEASDSGLIDLDTEVPRLTPLGRYLLSLETSGAEEQSQPEPEPAPQEVASS
ncbi:MAG TPA: hypothetical protein VNR67_01925 [Solirubrobacterales bacterium]|nr:hypothetical protein [Solirubrobacterales bacterium]